MDKRVEILALTNSFFSVTEEHQSMIKEVAPQAVLTVVNKKEVTKEQLEKAEIIFGPPEAEQLKAAKNLRWLQLPSAGADRYMDQSLYQRREIKLTNSSGVFGLPIAEHVLAMILSYNRKLTEYAWQQKEGIWKGIEGPKDFYGSTLGVIGLGDIGSEVAKRGKALGARVLGVKRTPGSKPEYVDELYTTEAINEVLEQADYVVLALPSTKKTEGIITEESLRRMKPDAFLVNIGRGALIDQEALIKALKEGWIGGAGLDVTTPEPLPQDSPLWGLRNVIITPHVSGGSPSNDRRRMGIFLRNLEHYLAEEPLENLVDFEEGY